MEVISTMSLMSKKVHVTTHVTLRVAIFSRFVNVTHESRQSREWRENKAIKAKNQIYLNLEIGNETFKKRKYNYSKLQLSLADYLNIIRRGTTEELS